MASRSPSRTYGSVQDIKGFFPQELTDAAFPYFVDWLIENVHLVEIDAQSDDDAYTIFRHNERPRTLTYSYRYVKGLSPVRNRRSVEIAWQGRRSLEDTTWASLVISARRRTLMRLKHGCGANTLDLCANVKQGRQPRDFDRLGTEFHRWLLKTSSTIRLKTSDDFSSSPATWIYTRGNVFASGALPTLTTQSFQAVHYNAMLGFTLPYMLSWPH